ncbi:MAG: hypothetical protein KGO81_07735 [Bacteroidota bacterium]|nr:hypothetical protein [Bacteroidota bacterium]
MSDDKTTELTKRHFEAVDKYVYFLLAAAGAAIGFSIQKVDNRPLSYSLIPLGLSVLCWGISFYSGCNCIKNKNNATETNLSTMTQYNLTTKISKEDYYKSIDSYAAFMKKSKDFSRWQFNFLIIGVILFICWTILEMYIKTVN